MNVDVIHSRKQVTSHYYLFMLFEFVLAFVNAVDDGLSLPKDAIHPLF